MEYVWLVQECGVTVAVCDTEATANKVIKQSPERELQKKKESIVADVIGDRFYYYLGEFIQNVSKINKT
jgi:hypothetical protein